MKKNKTGMILIGLLYIASVAALAVLYWVYIELPEAAYMFLVSAGLFAVLSLLQFLARESKVAFGILSLVKHAAGLGIISLGVLNYFLNMDFEPIYLLFDEFLMATVLFASALLIPALLVAEAKAAYCTRTFKLKAKWWQFIVPVLLAGACVYAYFVYPNYAFIWPILATFALIKTYICQLTLAAGGGQKFMALIKCLLAAGAGGLLVWFNLTELLAADELAIGNIILLAVAGVAALFAIVALILEFKQLSKRAKQELIEQPA